MAVIPKLDDANLQAICDILGATDAGLTRPKIGRYLQKCDSPESAPGITIGSGFKPLFFAKQNADRCANNVPGGIGNFGCSSKI
jgi:hypothetical protein